MITGILDSNQKIVSNGLVLNLDAAQKRSYPGSGTTWTDLSGNAYNGTLTNGPTFSSSNGGSINFDGTNDYDTHGNVLAFERTDPFSISAWFKVDSLSAGRPILSTQQATILRGCLCQVNTSGSLRFAIISTLNTNEIRIETDISIINTGQWYNLVATYDGSSDVSGMQQYVNGAIQSKNIITNNLTSTTATTASLIIGARTVGTAGYYDGLISIVNIYNRELSQDEITQNYNAIKSRFGL